MAQTPEAEELISIRNSLGLTIRAFASRLNVPEPRYKNWEYGLTKKVPVEVMERARGLTSAKAEPAANLRPVSLTYGVLVPIPVVGQVSAGAGAHNVDPIEREIHVPPSLRAIGGLAYIVDGESMMPALMPGDIAVFKETTQPRKGFTFLLKRGEGEFSVKNLDWKDNQWIMTSLNPNYPPESLMNVQLVGLLVGWYRSFGTYEKLESDPYGLRLEGPV